MRLRSWPPTVSRRQARSAQASSSPARSELLLALGARPLDIGQDAEAQWQVLADPEGNEFCLLRKRLEA